MMELEYTKIEGKIGITGSFDCWDKDGNLLKTITFEGTLPLENLITEDTENGTDSSE